jgi:hypothetical protein
MFVEHSAMDRAVAALRAAGYGSDPAVAPWFDTYYQVLQSPQGIEVDLQWYISEQRDVLPPNAAYGDSALVQADGVLFRILSPTHQIVHNIFHSEVQDRGHDLAFIWIRQLLDLAALCRRLSPEIDWGAVRAAFAKRRLGEVPSDRLYLAQELLGVPVASQLPVGASARRHLWVCLAQLRWPRLSKLNRLRATVTSPLNPRVLDMVYGSGHSRVRLLTDRCRHAWRMISHHRGNLFAAIERRLEKYL